MPEEICRQAGKGGDATYTVTPTGLDHVASGGESARVMLALKAAPVAAVDLSQQANGSAADLFPGAHKHDKQTCSASEC